MRTNEDSHPHPVGTIASFHGNDLGCDGMFLGGDGNVYGADTRPAEVPPFLPSNGESSGALIILVNGVLTTAESEAQLCQSLADSTGAGVVAIHNATSGDPLIDGLQCVGDKAAEALHSLDVSYRNEATETVRSVIEGTIAREEAINVFGHSQGALIISSAVTEFTDDRLRHGEDPEKTQADLSLVHAQTFGGAAWNYAPGPDYYHTVNTSDPVSSLVGVGHPDLPHLLSDAAIGQLTPELAREAIGETIDRLSGHDSGRIVDDWNRIHEFDHPEPLLHPDGHIDVQAHSFQLYCDALRNDAAALGAIVGAHGHDDDAGSSEHYLQGHVEINDWSPAMGGDVPDYSNSTADHDAARIDSHSPPTDEDDEWPDEGDGDWEDDDDVERDGSGDRDADDLLDEDSVGLGDHSGWSDHGDPHDT